MRFFVKHLLIVLEPYNIPVFFSTKKPYPGLDTIGVHFTPYGP